MGAIELIELSEFLTSQGFANSLEGDARLPISAVNTLEDAVRGEITFLTNPKYKSLLATTQASAVILPRDETKPNGMTVLRCDDAYAALTGAIIRIHGYRTHPRWGVHATASISASARIGPGANIGPHVTIADDAVIGSNVTLYPGCYLADGAVLGDDVVLFPNVVVYNQVRLGNRVTIHAGTVIGQDGLGYAPFQDRWLKIPQVGTIVIEDDVEIGAGCALDRATLGATRIGAGTKLSNQVVIGHGARIGRDCMIVAQVGVAGSTVVGNHVTLAGQVGISGHLTIGDHARVGAKSGVRCDIPPHADYQGLPAVESSEFRRQVSLVRRLPQMKERLRELEREVAALRQLVEADGRKG